MSLVEPTQFTGFDFDLDAIVDLERHPIHLLNNRRRAELVAHTRSEMATVGCSRISDFVRLEAVAAMRAEAEELRDQTTWSVEPHTPYFSPPDEGYRIGHPRRRLQERRSGFINSDLLTRYSRLRMFFDSDIVVHFLSECLDVQPLYRWADPLGRNPYGVMDEDHYFPWHFDGNDFTVSLLVQKAVAGGVFEYVPNIRQPGDENYERVQHILEGGRDGICELDLQPGDLQIFRGRHSMHRVTRIEGATSRYVGLPSYVSDPYLMNTPFHSENIYGRALPVQHARHIDRNDGLTD